MKKAINPSLFLPVSLSICLPGSSILSMANSYQLVARSTPDPRMVLLTQSPRFTVLSNIPQQDTTCFACLPDFSYLLPILVSPHPTSPFLMLMSCVLFDNPLSLSRTWCMTMVWKYPLKTRGLIPSLLRNNFVGS